MEKAKGWPLDPDHVSNDREEILRGLGIIPNRHLENELTDIAGKLGNPVVLLEFPVETDELPYHTRSKGTGVKLRPACDTFRASEHGKKCTQAEDRLANMFRGLDVSNLESEFWDRVERSGMRDEFQPSPDYCFDLRKWNGQYCLECDCPILGYRALTFPLIIEGEVLGVLYVGGLCLHDRQVFIESVMKRNQKLYDHCIRKSLSIHREWIRNRRNILGVRRYQAMIDETINELKSLSSRITERLNRQRRDFVEKKVVGYVSSFYHDLPKGQEMPLGNSGPQTLWKIVQSRLEEIRGDFRLEYIFLFGTKNSLMSPPSKLDLVATAVGEAQHGPPASSQKHMQFDLDKIPKRAMTHGMVSKDNPELFKGLADGNELDKEVSLISVLPAPSPSSTVVTWIGYGPHWNPISVPRYFESGKALERSIPSFYSVVVSVNASILAATAKDNMEKSLRIYRHEVGQLTSGMDALRETYISQVDNLRHLSPKKAEDLNRDWEGYLRQMHLLSDRARMVLEIPRPQRKHFKAFKQLLFKWKDTFRLVAEKRCIQFTSTSVESDDPLRPPIYGDEALLEQLVYNLIDNAVKYSHMGTKIRTDSSKADDQESSPHVLTVTNYGMEVERDSRLYELEYRGKNVAGVDGLGIGLYLAKQIAAAHNGTIQHTCKKISHYNVPLMEAYLNSDSVKKDADLVQSITEGLDDLKRTGEYLNVVALDESGKLRYTDPSPDEVSDYIKRQTWKVTFDVTIPGYWEVP